MKKTGRILFSVFCASVVLAACAKEAVQEKEGTEDQQIITAYVNANPTKLVYEEIVEGGGAGMTSTWQNGDHFLAIQDGEKVVDFQLISGAGTTQGVFQTRTSGVTSTTQWVGVVGNGAEAHSSEIHCPYMGQNGTIKSLGGFNYVKVTATGEEPYFNFAEGEGLSYVIRVKLPEGVKCIEYTPCAYQKVTSTGAANIVLYNTGIDDAERDYCAWDKNHTTTITLGSTSTKGSIIYIAVPPINCNINYEYYNNYKQQGNLRTGIVLTFLNNDSDNADMSNGVILGGNKDTDFNLTGKGGLIGSGGDYGSTWSFDYSELPLINRPKPSEAILIETGAYNQDISTTKEYVNGLTTYWAPFNVGATTYTESGLFFRYGEDFEDKTGSFADYTLRQQGTDKTNRPAIICYSHSAFPGSGATTFYTVAGTRYDVARIKWGIAWRMPYAVEGGALLNKSDISTETVSGQICVKIGNGNGQYIYIPCCGWYSDNAEHKETDSACVWTADKNQRSASNAGWDQAYAIQYYASTSKSIIDRFGMHRSLNVRPVLASSVIE